MARNRKNKNKHRQPARSVPSSAPASQTPAERNESRSAAAAPASRLQTMEQQRARHALDAVNQWLNRSEDDQKELKSYAIGMPAMILMSGFGQTCAFYKSKGGNHERILDALAGWLGKADLMAFITASSAREYQLAQAESLAWLNWLKKFARAYLKGDE